MKYLLIVFFGFLTAQFVKADNPYNCPNAIIRSEYIYQATDVNFPSCHASTILAIKGGFLACWFGGTEERNPDVCIYLSSNIHGKWTKPILVADGIEGEKRYPCWNPVLYKMDNNDIILYYKVGPSPRTWWGMYKVSSDNGKTWSKAFRLPEQFLGPIKNKPTRLADGRILYPTSVETAERWTIYLESSDQTMQNWVKTTIDNNHMDAIQPTILRNKDGSLHLLCRSQNKKIGESWSMDEGKTWSKLEPSVLPNNNSGIDAETLKDGSHVLIYNPITDGRNRLALAISVNGKDWQAGVLLEDDPNPSAEYSYPAVIQSPDGLIHVTYTWNRKLIKHVVIDLTRLKNKRLLNGEWPAI